MNRHGKKGGLQVYVNCRACRSQLCMFFFCLSVCQRTTRGNFLEILEASPCFGRLKSFLHVIAFLMGLCVVRGKNVRNC